MNRHSTLQFLASLLLSGATLMACQGEETQETIDSRTEIRLSSNLSARQQASAYPHTRQSTFDEGSNVYAWVDTENEKAYLNAWKLTADSQGILHSATTQYFPAGSNRLYVYAMQGNFTESIAEDETAFPQNLTHSVMADQWTRDGEGNYKKSDLTYAANEIGRPHESQRLTFRHMLTQIEVVLKAGGELTQEELNNSMTRVYLTNTRLNVDFSPAKTTAGEMEKEEVRRKMLAVDESDAANPRTNILIDTRTTSDFALVKDDSYARAVIVPQTVGAQGVPTPFIQVHLQGLNNARLEYKVANHTFKSGYKYTYHITVYDNRLDVIETVSQENAWTEGKDSQQIESEVSKYAEGFAPQNLKPGDYYYADGTWSDGGYRRFADETEGFEPVQPLEGKTLIGLVFYTGDVARHDNALRKVILSTASEPGEHGLVVALRNAETPAAWLSGTDGSVSVEDWRTRQGIGYQSIEANSLKKNNEIDHTNNNLNKLLGYNNTCVLRRFNQSAGKVQVTAVTAVDNYVPRPEEGTALQSGWYLPSPKELSLLITGEFERNIYFINYHDANTFPDELTPKQRTAMRTLLNQRLKAIQGAEPLSEGEAPYYYSSTENETFDAYVFVIDSTTGQITGTESKAAPSTGIPPSIRPILAF